VGEKIVCMSSQKGTGPPQFSLVSLGVTRGKVGAQSGESSKGGHLQKIDETARVDKGIQGVGRGGGTETEGKKDTTN